MRVDRIAPTDDEFGFVVCRLCGREWTTTPEQDELLRQLFEHDDTHDGHPVGGEVTHKGRLTALAKDAQQGSEGDHAHLGDNEP